MLSNSRAQVTQRVAELEQQISSKTLTGNRRKDAEAELAILRRRLAEGDLQVGDQLVITILGDSAVRADTATVRDGHVVSFGGLPDAEMAGVLQSEARDRLQAHTDRYFKNRTVRVNILTRLGVLGEVARPGFYSTSSDRPVSDLLMLAGGPTPLSELSKVSVRRNGERLISEKAWDTAQKTGMTIGQLGLRPGDEIEFGRRRQVNWAQISQIALIALAGSATFFQVLTLIYREE